MKRLVVIVALGVASWPGDALACRCEQLPLARYFDNAQFVAMAKLLAAEESPQRRILQFELMAAPYKGGTAAQTIGTAVRLSTPSSSATCGVQPELEAIYVLFGGPDGQNTDMLSVNTCNGTRAFLSSGMDEPVGFVDVPARFVAGQLNALFGLEVLRDVAANAPRPDAEDNQKLIGLLDLKTLAHGGHARVLSRPLPTAALLARVDAYDDIESREYAYEQPGAVVYAKLPQWYRVRLADGRFGWLPAEDAGTWFPYRTLPVRRLAYLTGEWSGLTWPEPGAGLPMRSELASGDGPREYPVEVHESRQIGGMTWFRVEVLRTDPCEGEPKKAGHSGWVPAYGRRGEPTVWFYSRGC